jgi:NADH:ubiquinone oxidoreductase subunit E
MMSLNVCVGSACHIKGSYNVIQTFQQLIEEYDLSNKIEAKAVFCLGQCAGDVSVQIDNSEVYNISGTSAKMFFETEVLPKLK